MKTSSSFPIGQSLSFDQQIVEANPSAIILVDAQQDDQPIVYANTAFEQLTGYTRDEVMGRNCRFLQGDDDDQVGLRTLGAAIQNGEGCTVTVRNYRKDGSLFWNELRISPVFDANGNLTHFVGAQQDITEQKQSEDNLHFLNRTMRDLIALTDIDSIYTYIGHTLDTLLNGQAIIVINQVTNGGSGFKIQGAYGLDATRLGQLVKVMGYSPVGNTYTSDPLITPEFEKGRLIAFEGGLIELSKRVVPPLIARQLVKLFGLGEVYLLGLRKDDEFYAGLQFYMRGDATIDNPKLVETFCEHASSVIQRIQATQSLYESEVRYRALFESELNLVYLHDTEGRFIDANDAALNLMGYQRDEIPDVTVASLVHPDDLPRVVAHVQEVQQLGYADKTEIYRLLHRDGSIFYIETALSVVNYGDSTGVIQGIARDITGRKRAEAALRASEKRYRMTIQGTRAGTWEWNLQTGEAVFNDRWAEIVGYTLEELAPISIQTWINLAHPDDLQKANAQLARHFSGELPFYECEARVKHKDGHWVWVLDRGQVLEWTPEGQPLRMFGTHTDITKLKHTEEALRESEAHLHSILNTQTTFVLRTDLMGRYTYVNDAMHQRFAWMYPTKADMLGTDSMLTILETDHHKTMNTVDRCLEHPGQPVQVELRKPQPDGGFFWGYWEFVALTDANGSIHEIQCVGIDVTERKAVQQREFELALERERRNILTTFIENTTHEFRTPLTNISNNAYLITRADDDATRQKRAGIIDGQVKRITNLVDMLLLMAHLESNRALTMTPFDLGQMLREIGYQINRDCDQQHTLIVRLTDKLPTITGNAAYLKQAIEQIIVNAHRFTPIGGTVTVSAHDEGSTVHITIQDTGAGISDDSLPHIFKTFWREDMAHSTPGFGLGLPIAQKIVQKHGGEITIASTQGHGTKVTVILPTSPN